MITNYFKAKYHTGMRTLDTLKTGVWTHAQSVTDDEVLVLTSEYGLDSGAVADALDQYEVPRTVHHGGWTYLYMRVPTESSREGIISTTTPLCIAVGPEYVVTIAQEQIPELWQAIVAGDALTTQKTRLICVIVAEITKMYHRYIADINRSLRKYALDDQHTDSHDVVMMLNYERSLNDFLDALVPMSTIMGNIGLGKSLTIFTQDKELVEDLQLTLEQLVVWSKSTLRTIQNMREAYSTILSNRLNQNIHHLTIMTIIFAIPTMIAGLYGMNVPLPGQSNSHMFWAIVLGAALVSVAIYIFVKKRH